LAFSAVDRYVDDPVGLSRRRFVDGSGRFSMRVSLDREARRQAPSLARRH
jgi:hypothetical protein